MTTVILTNEDNDVQTTKYYVKIYTTKIETDLTPTIASTLERPKSSANWGSASITQFIDLQQRGKTITVYGYIDKYSDRKSDWTAKTYTDTPTSNTDLAHDAGVVKQMIESMYDKGGSINLYVGTAADGYYNQANSAATNYMINGLILKAKIVEDDSDHVDRTSGSEDYPRATREITDKYNVVIQVRKGKVKGE
jgi:hypothetical protein